MLRYNGTNIQANLKLVLMNSSLVSQKYKLIFLLCTVCYFLVFIPPNLQGSKSDLHRDQTSLDENLQFSFLIRMLTPGKDWRETVSHVIDHLHYIYGYPFYVVNALVVLPVRIWGGNQFPDYSQLMMLLLRQIVSVLPILLSVWIFLLLQSRNQFNRMALATGIFILFLPGVIRQNIQWWHPDGLVILACAFTFHFLIKDNFQYGKFFYLAALACGLATAIKLTGIFFFLTVGWYLLVGILKKQISLLSAAKKGGLFIVIISGVFLFTNPMLLFEKSRELILKNYAEHSYFFSHGWDSGSEYDRNPLSWLPIITRWYGEPIVLLGVFGLLIWSCFRGKNQLFNQFVFFWISPLSLYLLFFIAVRPDHYWLPIMIPLISALINLPDFLESFRKNTKLPLWLTNIAVGLIIFLFLGQFLRNALFNLRLYENAIINDRLIEACEPASYVLSGEKYHSSGNWFLVDELDLESGSKVRKFYVTATLDLSPNTSSQKKYYPCKNETEARFKAHFLAKDYKFNHLSTMVIGPNNEEIPAPFFR